MQKGVHLQKFVLDFLNSLGAAVDRPSYAYLEALLPEEYAPHFGGDSHLRLAFHPEVAQEEDAEFITFGSPILDSITDLILQEPKVTRRRVSVQSLSLPENLKDRVGDRLTVMGGRPPMVEKTRLEDHWFLQFVFQVHLVSDEREELQEKVVVDLVRGCPMSKITDRLEVAFFQQEVEEPHPIPSMISLQEAFALAREVCEKAALRHKDRFEKRLGRFREGELEKVRKFFRETEENLEERLKKLDAQEKHRKRKETLREKLQANRQNRKRRIQDVKEKYACQVDITCDRLVAYILPRYRLTLLVQKGQQWHRLDLFYNPLLQRVERPVCPECRETTSLMVVKRGRFYCRSCGHGA